MFVLFGVYEGIIMEKGRGLDEEGAAQLMSVSGSNLLFKCFKRNLPNIIFVLRMRTEIYNIKMMLYSLDFSLSY